MKMKMKYRIVRDHYAGFEAQFRPWWWPFWMQCFSVNTVTSVEKARELIDRHASWFVEHYTPNQATNNQ